MIARARGRGWTGRIPGQAVGLTRPLSPPQSRHQKRARAQAQLRNLEAYAAQPHSFVFARGRAGRSVRQLSLDLRRVMEPLTATRLQVCTPALGSVTARPSRSLVPNAQSFLGCMMGPIGGPLLWGVAQAW